MDPDETLRLLREAARQNDGDAAIEYFEALDEWITNGGFPPKAWTSVL